MKTLPIQYFFIALVYFLGNFAVQAQDHHHHHGETQKKDTVKKEQKKSTQTNKKKTAKEPQHRHGQPQSEQQPDHGQHHQHGQQTADSTMHEHHDAGMPAMTHSFSLNLPMNRNGSGTSWLPDETPMYAYMKHSKKWNYMLHGNLFLRYNHQDIGSKGSRGGSKFDAPNWVMGMAQRHVGNKGLLLFRSMISLDMLTMGGSGYPLLFQSGETWQGKPLVDRQHPHDLFSELAVAYTHSFSRDMDAFVYLGYPGEPALSAPAFMHRISSLSNPDAPLGHHWQDATHITFGVATLGWRYKIFKLEGSSFTGREPGENRYDFDRPRFDSYSYRFSINPTANLALQFSQGWIKSPEAIEPGTDVKRTTASMLYGRMLGGNRHVTSALVWGLNDKNTPGHHSHAEHSVLLESNLQLGKTSLYGRYEFVQKDAHELQLENVIEGNVFNVNALTLGTSHVIFTQWKTNLAVGVQGSVFAADRRLDMLYGRFPVSGQVYVRLTPAMLN